MFFVLTMVNMERNKNKNVKILNVTDISLNIQQPKLCRHLKFDQLESFMLDILFMCSSFHGEIK